MTIATTRSTRFLAGLSTLLLVLSIAFGVVLVVGAVAGFSPSGHEVAVHTDVATRHVADLPLGAMPRDHVDVAVRVRHATRSQIGWAAGRDLTPGIVVVTVLWLLRGLLRSVRDGDPFTPTNVQRLRALALVVIIGVPMAILIASLFASSLANSAGLHSAIRLSMPGNTLLGGLALFVLAEVFATGVRLRSDLEGTI